MRLVVLIFSLALGSWILGAHHIVTWEALQQARHAVSQALMSAVLTGISYLAVEPHVRRRWPTVLVAWSRLFSGRWGDPLVGRDVLAGLALGAAAGFVGLVTSWLGSRTMDADPDLITRVLSTRTTLAALMTIPIQMLAFSLILTVLMLVLRTVARSNLLAVALVMLLAIVSAAPIGAGGMFTSGALALLSTTCLIRFGLVALLAFFLTGSVFSILHAALAWNSGAGTLILAAIVGLTLAATHVAMGSPRLPRARNIELKPNANPGVRHFVARNVNLVDELAHVVFEGRDPFNSGLRHVVEIGDIVECVVGKSIRISLAPAIQCSTFECNDRLRDSVRTHASSTGDSVREPRAELY